MIKSENETLIAIVALRIMTKADIWKWASSEKVADCRVFQIRRDICTRLPDGRKSDFFVIESPDWVNVIPVTTGGDIVLIEQFRHGTEDVHLELPGGLIDPGETQEKAAERELLEETGYSSDNWVLMGPSRPNPAIQNNTIYHFLALDCEKKAKTAFDANESIVTKLVPEAAVRGLVLDGSITHSLVLAAFLFFGSHRSKS